MELEEVLAGLRNGTLQDVILNGVWLGGKEMCERTKC